MILNSAKHINVLSLKSLQNKVCMPSSNVELADLFCLFEKQLKIKLLRILMKSCRSLYEFLDPL